MTQDEIDAEIQAARTAANIVPPVQKFSAGDLVRLKSGGPWMTIEYAFYQAPQDGPRSLVYGCSWFDDEKTLGHSKFTEAALVPG